MKIKMPNLDGGDIFLILAICVLATVIVSGILTEQEPKEYRIIPPEGGVLYNLFAEKEIKEFNKQFREIQAIWVEEDTILIYPGESYVELGGPLRVKHKLKSRGEMLNFAETMYLNIISIEGLESAVFLKDFCLRLHKQKDRSWESFMQGLTVVFDKYFE